TVGWISPLAGFHRWLDFTVGWISPLAGFHRWLDFTVGWISPLAGDQKNLICDRARLHTYI
ncbi:MAG TPA: hypothetical protein VGM68_07710, partial [Rhizomicrobium sp.]